MKVLYFIENCTIVIICMYVPFIVHYFEPKVQWGCLLEHACSFNHISPVQGILYARLTIPLQ